MEGRVFAESTNTVVLSRHGAGIISANKLSAEQEIVIRNEESRTEADARVVGQIGSMGDSYIYGVAFLATSIDFWGMGLPELSETEKLASQVLLECSGCGARVTADHSDLASDVMAVNHSIVRYCRKCLSSTLWRKPEGESQSSEGIQHPLHSGSDAPVSSWRESEKPIQVRKQPPTPAFASSPWTHMQTKVSPSEWEPGSPAVSMNVDTEQAPAAVKVPSVQFHGTAAQKEQENRRKHARTRVNFKACVRRADAPDDVVVCEDMSRGGLRFKSSKQYFEKMFIQIAVPYSPGDLAIYVSGQIVFVQELPEQKLFRCGVMYLRNSK